MPKLPAVKKQAYHLIVKEIKDFAHGLEIINKLPSVGIQPYFCSYELGSTGNNPHIHLYAVALYTRRYYTDHIHEVFPNKYILKLVKQSLTDHKRIISYIFKDGETYSDYTSSQHNIHYITDSNSVYQPPGIEESINLYELYQIHIVQPPTIVSFSQQFAAKSKALKTYTQKLCQHFYDHKDEIYKKHLYTDLPLTDLEVAEATIHEVMDYTNMSLKSIDKVIINRFVLTVLNSIPEYRSKLKKSISSQLKYNIFV